jgi:hypothetical protein
LYQKLYRFLIPYNIRFIQASSTAKMAPILNNQAAWIKASKAYPLEVGPGPQPDPAEDEVVIKVAYAAANPLDWRVRRPFYPR